MDRNIEVSIIIVSFNTSRLLNECLASIKARTNVSYEVFVIDNASRDDTVSMLKSKYPEINLIENSSNYGFASANNQGFRASSGRYLFMLNPDTVVLGNAIDELVEFMDAHHEVGACGPKNIGCDGMLQHNCHHFPTILMRLVECLQLKRLFPESKYFGRENMTYWNYAEIKDVDWITGCSLLIRREALDQVGFLDENYFMYTEETDLCYRLHKGGWNVFYCPFSVILHYGGQSALSQNDEKVFSKSVTAYLFSTKYYFIKKNYGALWCFGMKAVDSIYYLLIIIKNIFRKNAVIKTSRIEEAKTVLSLIFKKI